MGYKERKEKRLILDVTPAFHEEVKVRAAKRNMSIKNYVMAGVGMLLQQDEKYIPLKDLKDTKG